MPCEMFRDCGNALGMISAPPPRSGGGALSLAVAISSMLGAGASAAPALVWTAGALPAFTKSGAAPASALSPVLFAADESEDFVELGVESASSRAESSSSDACPFAAGGVVWELGNDVDDFGAAVAAGGFEPLSFGA